MVRVFYTWRATAGGLSKLTPGPDRWDASGPLPGVPDATFFNPKSGLVHVAIENPGLV
jgi:hypothetical protein